ncbi:MAG: ABC transporter ATP-binding protein [Candidatus Limnocylindrales bacterium]
MTRAQASAGTTTAVEPDPAVESDPAVELRGVTIAHGRVVVVHAVDLVIRAGETVALLGPSGSGKSSLLSAVAGFLQPVAGELRIAGRLVAGRGVSAPPEDRSVGVVFQNDALWPHLTVLETVAYPIERRGVARAQARQRARAILDRVGIGPLADRRPAQLSGGEQQRTGVARALAREAAVYLMDEPTARLDSALKATLQQAMADQVRDLGAAVLYATHDVAEALAIADRIALLRDGRRVQLGTPLELYEHPVDAWAARITGIASVLTATADGVPNTAGQARVLVRPDWAGLGGGLPGRVEAVWFRGSHTDVDLATPFGALVIRTPGTPSVVVGADANWHLRRAWPLVVGPDGGSEGGA